MVPLGSNPHLLAQQQTTRAALFSDEISQNGNVPCTHEELEAEVKMMNTLLQQTLGNFSSDLLRVKKLKLQPGTLENNEPPTITPFRLISSTLPPRPISLAPSYHESIPHQRPAEDTLAEEISRRERAEQVAVDADWVFMQSRLQDTPVGGPSVKIFIPADYHTSPFPLSSLLVTERIRSKHQSALADKAALKGIRCCPLLSVKDLAPSPTIPKKRRRKRKRASAPRDTKLPQFFRPMQQWGGKSAGYAMGWNDSHPAIGTGSYRYVRDTMRKGITLSRLEQIGNYPSVLPA